MMCGARRPRFERIVAGVPAALLALLMLAAAAAHALEIPARPSGRVSDYANLLDAPERASLERRLAAFEDSTSSQIAVAIFPSLEGESLEDFVNRLFAKWALGQTGRDNGVLLAIFVAERRARIEVGYGFEGSLTDAMSARILRDRLTPAFREERYAEGIAAAVQGMEEATRGEFKGDPRSRASGDDTARSRVAMGFFILFVMFVLMSRMSRFAQDSTVIGPNGVRRRRRGGGWGGPFIGGGGGGFGGWSSGGGGGGFSGGGFSGGGGRSGGGGASGGW